MRSLTLLFLFGLNVTLPVNSFAASICNIFLQEVPVFLDFEASSLKNGFPTEVAWTKGNVVRKFLIRPEKVWLDKKEWDLKAEEITGITLVQLQEKGLPITEIIEAMRIDGLFEKKIYVTSPLKDGEWMRVLIRGTSFEVEFDHIQSKFMRMGKLFFKDDFDLYKLTEKSVVQAQDRAQGVHRAGVDVQTMLDAYQIFITALLSKN